MVRVKSAGQKPPTVLLAAVWALARRQALTQTAAHRVTGRAVLVLAIAPVDGRGSAGGAPGPRQAGQMQRPCVCSMEDTLQVRTQTRRTKL